MEEFTEEDLKLPPVKYEFCHFCVSVAVSGKHATIVSKKPWELKLCPHCERFMLNTRVSRCRVCTLTRECGITLLIVMLLIVEEDLDHTADVQLHAWGDNLEEAFEQCAMAMFAYMTEIEYVEMKEAQEIEATGHDMLSLLFHFLDEFLFLFCAEPFFIARKVKILEFDRANFHIKARGYGEEFQLGKHPQGTEVKAITYSNMQVHDNEGQHEVFVIIDI